MTFKVCYSPVIHRPGVVAVELRELRALEIAARSKITYDGKTWGVRSS